MLDVKVDYIEP